MVSKSESNSSNNGEDQPKKKVSLEGLPEVSPDEMKNLPDDQIAVIIHKTLLPAILQLENVWGGKEWKGIGMRVGHNEDSSQMVVEVRFVGGEANLIIPAKHMEYPNDQSTHQRIKF